MITASLTAAFALPTAAIAWYLAPMSIRRRQENRLQRLCSSTDSLVLTYDDGPGAELTPRLLELLRSRNAKATFFLAGFRAAEHPEVIDEIATEGHELGCHGQNHLNAWRTTPWRAAADLREGYRTLSPWIPRDGLYRPPHGKTTLLTLAALRRRGARLGWWNIVGGDVEAQLSRPERAAREAEAKEGGIVLLHDFDREPERAEFVLNSTEMLLDAADRNGWTIRTLGELMSLQDCADPGSSRAMPLTH